MPDHGSTPSPPPHPGPGDDGYAAAPPPVGGPAGPPPPNNLVLAILGLLCCWPIGIPAVVFAAQVNGKWAAGDQAGAVEASGRARKFATIALVLGIVVSILYAVLLALGAAGGASYGM